MDKIKKYKSYRNTAINDITILKNLAEKAKADKSVRSLFRVRYAELECIREEFLKNHNSLVSTLLSATDAETEPEDIIREGFLSEFFAVKSIYVDLFESDVGAHASLMHNSTVACVGNVQPNVRLPKIELKRFSGDYKAFTSFIDHFNSLIHENNSLTTIEKFNYLISSLQGQPLSIVRTLPLTSDNYDIAYKTLVDRYSNTRLIAQAHWAELDGTSKIDSENPVTLRKLLDIFSENLAALKALSLPTDEWSFVLVMMLMKRLDGPMLTRFEMDHKSSQIPSYDKLTEFLNSQCVILDTLKITSQGGKKTANSDSSSFRQPTATQNRITSMFMNKSPASCCIFCQQNHSLYHCQSFTSRSPKERYDFCKGKRLCFNCLSSSHDLKSCRSSYGCRKCSSKSHHTLLHQDKISTPVTTVTKETIGSSQGSVASTSVSNVQNQPDSVLVGSGIISHPTSVLLATAYIKVLDTSGNYQPLRCLLDSGSMSSFLTQRAVTKLGLPKTSCSIEIKGLDSMESSVSSGRVTLSFQAAYRKSPVYHTDAIILNNICNKLPDSNICYGTWDHIANLQLADPDFHRPGNVDVLLGADIFSKVLLNGRISGKENEPDAINTIFGFVLMGKTSSLSSSETFAHFCSSYDSPSMEDTLKKFWEIESVPDKFPVSSENETCENIFLETVRRDRSGHYTVSLPFKGELPEFPGIRDLALYRFYSLERRLLKNPALYSQYSEFMKEYLELHHMELITEKTLPLKSYYLPHHCVIKPDSLTTKLRCVFNASAKLPNQTSLNDHLHIGTKLQQDIVEILLNFRLHAYVLCCDIKQMFRMISIEPAHRDYQRIIWRFSANSPIQDYRHTRICFGVNCSPFLALRTLRHLADTEGNDFPRAASAIKNFCYIDDFVISLPSRREAELTRNELITLMKRGGFELRKWSSNDPTLLADLPMSHLSKNPLFFSPDSPDNALKILGLSWNPSHDCFSFSVNPSMNKVCTKRTLLSELARIYDPLGFIAPVTFFCKNLIQRLWISGIGWDDPPCDEIIRIWSKYQADLPLLCNLKIPRNFTTALNMQSNLLKFELHGFSDASERGYACVIYLRILDGTDNIVTNLICSKSKVAPVRKITIPRLELCAAVLLAKLMKYVIDIFDKKLAFSRICAWSDSQIALCWIKGSPQRWKKFVANRVIFIQDHLPQTSWHYIDTAKNPADIASRGVVPSQLICHPLWFTGPPFLRETDDILHTSLPTVETIDLPIEEEVKTVLFTTQHSENCLDAILETYSSFRTIQNIICYMLRFGFNLRNPSQKRSGPLLKSELHYALLILVKRTQQSHFEEELDSKSFSKPLRKLQVFLDEENILRVGGRLKHASISYSAKFPILLPRQSRLTVLLINYFHEKFFHSGFRTTHFLLSQQFWILSSKRAIHSVISKCIRCWKTKPKSNYQPLMGNLPECRLVQVKPFSRCGVDFGGPFSISFSRQRGVRTTKAYLCIFVCFATKAVHLELASDLSTEVFLAALQRLIARRGHVSHIHSDCGTNFLGANRELNKLMKDAADHEKITWHPSPASAPHFNGLCEAGVKSVKSHLARVVGQQILTYEEFYTSLTLIEAILNSRPLAPLGADIEDIHALTPSHFLNLEPVTALPLPDFTELPINRLSRWQLIQRINQDFWKRWQREYLHSLQQRGKWLNTGTNPEIGTLVLIKADNLPPCRWLLGRIITLHVGNDKVARVATVKTASGTLKRPLVKLCPLPLE